jgi:ABC-2 type transport system ATP-binding protein
MSEAEHCDRLALMYAGRVVIEGSPGEMKRQVEEEAGQLLEVVVDQPGNALVYMQRAGFDGAALFGAKIHLLCRDPVRDAERVSQVLATSGVTIKSVTTQPLGLEDVFVYKVMALEEQERISGTGNSV